MAMSRPSTLQVNLSEVKRKPLLPGPNSWAQDAQKANVMKDGISGSASKGVATNRSKYEVSHPGELSLFWYLLNAREIHRSDSREAYSATDLSRSFHIPENGNADSQLINRISLCHHCHLHLTGIGLLLAPESQVIFSLPHHLRTQA